MCAFLHVFCIFDRTHSVCRCWWWWWSSSSSKGRDRKRLIQRSLYHWLPTCEPAHNFLIPRQQQKALTTPTFLRECVMTHTRCVSLCVRASVQSIKPCCSRTWERLVFRGRVPRRPNNVQTTSKQRPCFTPSKHTVEVWAPLNSAFTSNLHHPALRKHRQQQSLPWMNTIVIDKVTRMLITFHSSSRFDTSHLKYHTAILTRMDQSVLIPVSDLIFMWDQPIRYRSLIF